MSTCTILHYALCIVGMIDRRGMTTMANINALFMTNYSKHTEAHFAQMDRSVALTTSSDPDLVIFVSMTTTTQLTTSPLVHAHRVMKSCKSAPLSKLLHVAIILSIAGDVTRPIMQGVPPSFHAAMNHACS